MKIITAGLACLALFFFLMYEARLNNAFVRSLRIDLDTTKTFVARPGDTLWIETFVTNDSHRTVEVKNATGSCRVSDIDVPRLVPKKTPVRLKAMLVTPTQEGRYEEQVVLRTNAEQPFYGFTIPYEVRAGTPTLAENRWWLAPDRLDPVAWEKERARLDAEDAP